MMNTVCTKNKETLLDFTEDRTVVPNKLQVYYDKSLKAL